MVSGARVGAKNIATGITLNTTSGPEGNYTIPNVPPGRYTMRTWYETALPDSLDAMTKEINVTASTSTLGVLEISSGTAVAHKNKYGMEYEPPAPSSPAYEHP